MAAYVISTHHISISRACKVVCLPKSMYYYIKKKDDSETMDKLRELAEKYPTEGQDLYYSRILDIPTKVHQCSALKFANNSGAKYTSQTGHHTTGQERYYSNLMIFS